jgi:hypothetical protein
MTRYFTLAGFLFLFFLVLNSFSQENKGGQIKLSADIVNNYIWRGCPGYSPIAGQNVLSVNIQPTLALDWKNLEIGAWGSSDFTGSYKEIDIYALYNAGNFTFTVTDYYWDLDWLNKRYFNYNHSTTGHIFEGSVAFKSGSCPVSILIATMFAGADKKFDDPEKNNYSTYCELGYNLKINEKQALDLFLGMTPADGFYGDSYGGTKSFGVVNAGVSANRTLKISDSFEIPLKASLITNPMHEKIYLVLGMSL